MRIGGLCFGYGGLDLAVAEVLGAELAWYSEIDPGTCKVAAHRFPGVPNVGDMTKADWSAVEPVDVITGGTPCQDLSHAGKRGGMSEGTRSNLWVAMREAVAALRPSLVIWENVQGALSARADSEMESREGRVGVRPDGPVLRALGRVLGDLAGLGYDAGWHGLRAADVGAPHGRFRVFVIAHDTHRVGCEHGHPGQPRGAVTGTGATAADAPQFRHERVGRSRRWWAGSEDGGLLPTPRATRGGSNTETAALIPTPLNSDAGPRGGTTGFGLRDWSRAQVLLPTPTCDPDTGNGHARNLSAEARLLPTPMVGSDSPAAHGQISGQYRDAMAEALNNWGQYAAAIARWEAVLGRPAPPPTQPSRKGTPQLSPRFSEWLMGLPDGWVTDVPGITRNEALRALGNGVVPQQATAALRYLLAHLAATGAAS